MSLFLNEHQIGFDPQHIGFPSLGSCLAVVLVTSSGLYGFHFTPGSTLQAGPFKNVIEKRQRDIGVTDQMLHLYGSCRRGRRWQGSADKKAKWKEEMRKIADELGYRGKISGYDLSSASHGPSDSHGEQSVYLEYLLVTGTSECKIQYKRMSKMTKDKGDKDTDYSIDRVRRDPNSRDEAYTLMKPKSGDIAAQVRLDTTKTKSATGKMHSPGSPSIDSFVY